MWRPKLRAVAPNKALTAGRHITRDATEDLKLGEFLPEHAGQLRFYVNYLAEHVAHPDENPPVGILLCAERDAEVVRFATAGTDDVFVTRYQLELPTAQQLESWLHEQRARMELAKDNGQPRVDGA